MGTQGFQGASYGRTLHAPPFHLVVQLNMVTHPCKLKIVTEITWFILGVYSIITVWIFIPKSTMYRNLLFVNYYL